MPMCRADKILSKMGEGVLLSAAAAAWLRLLLLLLSVTLCGVPCSR